MPLLYHAYVYLEFLILACTIYILAPIHPKRMFCPEDLERILKETLKEATPDEDYLSDEIYYYDRGARKIMKWKKVVSKVTLPASCVERLPL